MARAGRSAVTRFTIILAGSLVLAGCQMANAPGIGTGAVVGGQTAALPAAGPGQRVIERDVEAPEVFQVEDSGLWDGRPSLGGVWVAHPGVRDPERALIRNTTTGATVIGALFRRERDNPGPRFQVSSEAANALGLLAGAPAQIQVIALRLQRVEMELDPAPQAAREPASETLTAADETLAIAPVEAASEPVAGTPQGAALEGQISPADAAPPRHRPRHRLRDIFRRRAASPASTNAQTTAAPVGEVAAATATDPSPETAAPAPERRGLFDLFRRRPPEPDTSLIALPSDDDAAPQTAPTPASTSDPAPPAPRLDRPLVQIGIFSVEQNAQGARVQMQRAGMSAEIRRGRVGENLFWRVVVGPSGTTAERAEVLRRVRGLGFADAYAVVR